MASNPWIHQKPERRRQKIQEGETFGTLPKRMVERSKISVSIWEESTRENLEEAVEQRHANGRDVGELRAFFAHVCPGMEDLYDAEKEGPAEYKADRA